MEPENQKANVTVSDPILDTSETFSFVTYLVHGQDGEDIETSTYSDKKLFNDGLASIFLPFPLKSQQYLIGNMKGNTDERFVESRKNFLNYFCSKIGERPFLYNSDVFQVFIRNKQEFEKAAKELPKIDYESLCLVYQKYFTELTEKVSSAQLQIMTQTDYEFMKKAEKKLQKLRDQFKEAIDAKNEYQKQFNTCMSSILPQYEEKFLLKYVQEDRSNLLLCKDEQFSKKLKEYQEYTSHNPLEDYVELISYELREMRAFIEAIDSRKKMQGNSAIIQEQKSKLEGKRRDTKEEIQKLNSGKTTFKSLFSSGTKVQQIKELEEQNVKSEKNEEALGKLIYLMNAATYQEILQYKERRSDQYPKNVKEINKKQIKEMDMYGKLLSVPLGFVNEHIE